MIQPIVALTLLFAFLTPWNFLPNAPLPSEKMKATWLWDTEMIGTPEGRASILQFAQEHALGRIYVQVNGDVSRSAYSDFIGTASESGIQVHALDGAPKWALPSHRKQLTDMVSWVTEYNRSVQPDERFGGIQIDIEPYQLPEWSTKQDAVTAQWLDATAAFASEARKQDASLTVSAALPFWLDTVTVPETGQTAIEGMMKQLDEVTLMSYRDSAEALIEITAAEMALGDKLGIKVFVGVETNPVNEAAFVTFHSKGKGEMGRQMAVIDQKLSAHPSYSGIAIHDYSGWKRLKD